MYDSLLSDLNSSVFVYTDNPNTIKHLTKFYKVIERNKTSTIVNNEYIYISIC